MKIGIDIDDILSHGMQALINFHNERYGTNYRLEDIYGVPNYEIWGGTRDIAISRFKEFYLSPFFADMPPIDDAIKNISGIKDCDLFVVTSRLEMTEKVTRKWLTKYFGDVFGGVFFASNHNSGSGIRKSDICKNIGIDLLIEDSLFHASDCSEKNIPVIILDWPWNQSERLPQNIKRAYTWEEIVELINNTSPSPS
jgi:uncharacterized HAD superfamily protein